MNGIIIGMTDANPIIANTFNKVSIVVPVINETTLLKKTIEIIESECEQDVLEYLLVVCKKTTQESLIICNQYHEQNPKRFHLHHQEKPFLGNAIREGFLLAKASHVITMASDCETDPNDVKRLIAKAKQYPEAVITTSRWHEGCEFKEYGKLKKILNFGFQKMLQLLYQTSFTDLTFCFRLMPTELAKTIQWQGEKHPFLLETILKPLRLKVSIIEIPTNWKARTEGESQNSLITMFSYTPWAFLWRFQSPKKWINKQ